MLWLFELFFVAFQDNEESSNEVCRIRDEDTPDYCKAQGSGSDESRKCTKSSETSSNVQTTSVQTTSENCLQSEVYSRGLEPDSIQEMRYSNRESGTDRLSPPQDVSLRCLKLIVEECLSSTRTTGIHQDNQQTSNKQTMHFDPSNAIILNEASVPSSVVIDKSDFTTGVLRVDAMKQSENANSSENRVSNFQEQNILLLERSFIQLEDYDFQESMQQCSPSHSSHIDFELVSNDSHTYCSQQPTGRSNSKSSVVCVKNSLNRDPDDVTEKNKINKNTFSRQKTVECEASLLEIEKADVFCDLFESDLDETQNLTCSVPHEHVEIANDHFEVQHISKKENQASPASENLDHRFLLDEIERELVMSESDNNICEDNENCIEKPDLEDESFDIRLVKTIASENWIEPTDLSNIALKVTDSICNGSTTDDSTSHDPECDKTHDGDDASQRTEYGNVDSNDRKLNDGSNNECIVDKCPVDDTGLSSKDIEEQKDNTRPTVVQHLVDISSMLSKYVTMEYFSDGGALTQALWSSGRKVSSLPFLILRMLDDIELVLYIIKCYLTVTCIANSSSRQDNSIARAQWYV